MKEKERKVMTLFMRTLTHANGNSERMFRKPH